MKRGAIFFADLSPVRGSEQGGIRPVLISQNDLGNRYSQTIIIAAITTKKFKKCLPTHIHLKKEMTGLKQDSTLLVEQIRTIDKSRMQEKICQLPLEMMTAVDQAIKVSLALSLRTGDQ